MPSLILAFKMICGRTTDELNFPFRYRAILDRRCAGDHMYTRAGVAVVVLAPSTRSRGMGAANARSRVFILAAPRVTMVAILFPSVLTARALFHMNSMRVLMLNPFPS